ncbi:MAG: class I SAM-dependent methyltransferase [Candidatus Bathyarchaeia archaeon]
MKNNKINQKKTVQNYYSKRAQEYDTQKTRTWKSKIGFSQLIIKEILEAIRKADSGLGLEVGIGSGRITFQLSQKTSIHMVGVDISKEMLKLANKKAGKTHRSVDLVQADAEFLPFHSNSFTFLVCISTLHYFPSPKSTLTELCRVIHANGIFIIGDITLHEEDSEGFMEKLEKAISPAHKKYFKPSEMKELLKSHGIKLEKLMTVPYKKTYKALWEDKAKYFNIKPKCLYEILATATPKEKGLYEIGLKDMKLFYTLIVGRIFKIRRLFS